MSLHRRTVALTVGAVLTAAAAAAALTPSLVSAQQAPPAQPPRHERPMPRSHIDGRIAFLHAELKITPTQQTQFDRVAAAMRANATQRTQRFEQMRADRDKPRTAVDSLEQRAHFIEAQASAEKAFADAFKPLYATFSDEQKKAADELFERGFHDRGRHGRG